MHNLRLGGARQQLFNLERSVSLVSGEREKGGREEQRLAACVPKTVEFDCVLSCPDDTGQ